MLAVKGSDDSIAATADVEEQADLFSVLGDETASSPFNKDGAFRAARDRGLARGSAMPDKPTPDRELPHPCSERKTRYHLLCSPSHMASSGERGNEIAQQVRQ